MFRLLATTFGPSPRQVRSRQLHEAQIALLHHAAEAEKHEALTVMYRDRCERLQGEVAESRTPAEEPA